MFNNIGAELIIQINYHIVTTNCAFNCSIYKAGSDESMCPENGEQQPSIVIISLMGVGCKYHSNNSQSSSNNHGAINKVYSLFIRLRKGIQNPAKKISADNHSDYENGACSFRNK
jgi:hypothetical protein